MNSISIPASVPIRSLIKFERLIARLLVGVVAFGTIVGLLAFASLSLTELTARHRLVATIDELIAQRNAELAAIPPLADQAAASARGDSLRRELGRYQQVRFRTQLLIASGGMTSQDEVFALRSVLVNRPVSTDGAFKNQVIRDVRLLPSDMLLMMLLSVCGAVGAVVGLARKNASLTLSQVGMGLAAGFITFLAISGGKEVFLFEPAEGGVGFNPYSSALFALLAGLFTERTYSLLSFVVDSVSDRIKQSLRGSPPAEAADTARAATPSA
jgi:hypothetical protein